MRKVEFVGGISKELAAVIEEYNIPCTCIEGTACLMTEDAYDELYKRARAAFDGGDIISESYESDSSKAVTSLKELAGYLNSNESDRIGDSYGAELVMIARRNGWDFVDQSICLNGIRYYSLYTDGRKTVVCNQADDCSTLAVVIDWSV